MRKVLSAVLAAVLTVNLSTAVSAAFDKSDFESKYAELVSLIELCEASGINVDKEKVNTAVIGRFTDCVKFDDMLDGKLAEEGTSLKALTGRTVAQQVKEMNALYAEAKNNLTAYVNGEEKSNSPSLKYKDELTLKNNGLEIDGAPYYSVGFGHFNNATEDIPIFADMAADNVAMEIGPSSVLELTDKENKIYTNCGALRDKTANSLKEKLETAKKENVGINLLLSPHYMPDWALEMYPELKNASFGWCKYNIFESNAKKLLSDYLAGILPEIADCSALRSVILTNEPSCVTYRYPDVFTSDFRVYLYNKHGNIANLNKAWGTEYKKFSSINMPEYDSETGMPLVYDACFYDWYEFNAEMFADWHEWMATEVGKYLPNVNISVKVLNYFWTTDNNDEYRGYWLSGNDVERYSEFCDYAGTDAYGNISDYGQIINKYMWYDFAKSVTGQAIYNSEDHIFYDGYKVYGDSESVQDEHAAAGIWEGAIHGCEMTTLWTWQRLDYTPSGSETWTSAVQREMKLPYAATFLHRPEVDAAIGKQSINLRRLNDEVRTLEKSKNSVALLYSNSARTYNKDYMSTLNKAYEAMIAAGIGADFVTEYKSERMFDYDTIVLTAINNIKAETLENLADFAENGGNVIIADSSLAYNEYNLESDGEALATVTENAVNTGFDTALLQNALSGLDTRSKKLELKNSSGEIVKGIDFKYTVNDDGSILANICNLSNADIKKLTLYSDGKAVSAENLIDGAQITQGFTAKRYSPILIYISGDGSLLKNISVKSDADGKKIIKWDRELFPAYVYEIENGLENKAFVGIGFNKFKTESDGIYYLQKSDGKVIYPGRILSLQTDTVFKISQTDSGFSVKNVSDSYAAGILAVSCDKNGKMSEMSMKSIYLAPDESTEIFAEDGAAVVVYNNIYERVKISNEM